MLTSSTYDSIAETMPPEPWGHGDIISLASILIAGFSFLATLALTLAHKKSKSHLQNQLNRLTRRQSVFDSDQNTHNTRMNQRQDSQSPLVFT